MKTNYSSRCGAHSTAQRPLRGYILQHYAFLGHMAAAFCPDDSHKVDSDANRILYTPETSDRIQQQRYKDEQRRTR
jgi:hypothetical protein